MSSLDSPNLPPEKIRELAEFVSVLKGIGKSPLDIIAKLREKGLNDAEIEQVFAYSGDTRKAENKSSGQRDMIIGGVCLLAGLGITFGSYYAAVNNGGGRYFASYGLIIYGIVKLIQGIIKSSSA